MHFIKQLRNILSVSTHHLHILYFSPTLCLCNNAITKEKGQLRAIHLRLQLQQQMLHHIRKNLWRFITFAI